ncbi:MAG: iron-sulfur cluster insertion protein ErpA [Coxiella sp. RIFCSPHIGHO2_12_FULL_42_15]|nr:MAG: iron-sulfur cluster insertion protein ErpA [Coxiella sp. RIFCSPHIGHO2_12_FULL_42_15]
MSMIVFTDNAAHKVKSLIDEEGNPALNLRVYITGGGCSGFQYGFTFDETIHAEEDYVVEKTVGPNQTVRLLVDPNSFMYLQGAEIDYREDIHGAQFIIRNPNAKTTCGCGSSFSVQEEEEETDDA